MQSLGDAQTVKRINIDYRNNQIGSHHFTKATNCLTIGLLTQAMIGDNGKFLGKL